HVYVDPPNHKHRQCGTVQQRWNHQAVHHIWSSSAQLRSNFALHPGLFRSPCAWIGPDLLELADSSWATSDTSSIERLRPAASYGVRRKDVAEYKCRE